MELGYRDAMSRRADLARFLPADQAYRPPGGVAMAQNFTRAKKSFTKSFKI